MLVREVNSTLVCQ